MILGLVITSDKVYLDPKLDKVTDIVRDICSRYELSVERRIVRNNADMIKDAVLNLCGDNDVILVTGGTGLGPRDISIEALEPMFSKKINGFGELFRFLSYKKIGAKAYLSRATAGLIGNTPVFIVPGKPDAVRLALEDIIMPTISHLIEVIRGYSHWEEKSTL